MTDRDATSNRRNLAELAHRFVRAATSGDADELRAVYAANATIWHNFDGREQTLDENLRMITWLTGALSNIRYEEIRRVDLADGFLQQHVMRATGPAGELAMPAMLRVYVTDGQITRLEEYLDPAALTAALRTT